MTLVGISASVDDVVPLSSSDCDLRCSGVERGEIPHPGEERGCSSKCILWYYSRVSNVCTAPGNGEERAEPQSKAFS